MLSVLAVSFLAHDTIDVIHVIAHSGLVLFSFSLPVLAFCSLGFGMIGLGAHAPPDCWSTYPAYPLAHSRAWLCYVLRCAARCGADVARRLVVNSRADLKPLNVVSTCAE